MEGRPVRLTLLRPELLDLATPQRAPLKGLRVAATRWRGGDAGGYSH